MALMLLAGSVSRLLIDGHHSYITAAAKRLQVLMSTSPAAAAVPRCPLCPTMSRYGSP